jgi:hypothetical protein
MCSSPMSVHAGKAELPAIGRRTKQPNVHNVVPILCDAVACPDRLPAPGADGIGGGLGRLLSPAKSTRHRHRRRPTLSAWRGSPTSSRRAKEVLKRVFEVMKANRELRDRLRVVSRADPPAPYSGACAPVSA